MVEGLVICEFCDGQAVYRYTMNGYAVFQCLECKTGFVNPMPHGRDVIDLYDGFIPQLSAERYQRNEAAAKIFFGEFDLPKHENLRMLDVGGGGGFYCKAFGELGYGSGHYVDLDPVSCHFAENELLIPSVHQEDALTWSGKQNSLFDFIYCRHVVEHLPEPARLIEALARILSPGGILVVQCPNAESREYLAYARTRLRDRIYRIETLSHFRRIGKLRVLLGGAFLHGMDPPRHLWSITATGMQSLAIRNSVECETFSRHLGDIAYSPNYATPSGVLERFEDIIGQKLLARISGGTHLVAVFTLPGAT